ncbi:hypothetical protein ACVCAH_24495 [Micromonospora sp. LZ34]
MASFAGGVAQAGYMGRVRDLPPQRCLVIPVDVGKRTAMAFADHYGQIVEGPFEFDLTVSGALMATVAAVRQRVKAESVRIGVEAAGHYHQALATALRRQGFVCRNLRMLPRMCEPQTWRVPLRVRS